MASWQKDSGTSFVNPYNFVPLSKADVVRGYQAEEGGSLCGVIKCTLRTRTPMAVPDMEGLPQSQVNGLAHKGEGIPRGVPFFRVPSADGGAAGIPTIPGSEIRGVIRSAFEALDNGCLSVNNSNIASARSAFPLRPAILQATDGVLSLCEARKLKKSEAHNQGAIRRSWHEPNGRRNELNGRRIKTSHFAKSTTMVELTQEELQRAVRDYRHVVDIYKKNDANPTRFDSTHTLVPDPLPSNGSWVVFYTILKAIPGTDQEDVLYLSPAQITRTVFRKRVNDLLGSHAKCEDSGDMCEACAMFGMIGKRGQASSCLRFGDATMRLRKGESYSDCLIGGVTLKELSSPKPSSLEFYTKRPLDKDNRPARMWTYDGATYGYKQRGQFWDPMTKRFPPETSTLVRGRKFYLHHYVDETGADKAILDAARSNEQTIRNMTVEVVRSGVEFTFDVYFERLREDQLAKLVWTLCIGENDLGGTQLHMVGHGKPLGLGSSKIKVDRVLVRELGDAYRLVERNVGDVLAEATFPDQDVVRDYRTITSFILTKGLTVSYPLADDLGGDSNSQASHQWFAANVSVGEGGEGPLAPSAHRALPKLPRSAANGSMLLLPKYIQNGRGSNRDVECPFELEKEDTVKVPEPEVREVGIVNSARIKNAGGRLSCSGYIRRQNGSNLFFHSNYSPNLDLAKTPLKQGMKVSFTVGKNTRGKDPNQDCAHDIRVESV